ncbi:MAG: CbiX/SirB N-terminal domain-containing protein [Betaproteobacteria bacterium]|nr:CbiX/SirB N-terminal domain-containing protein [Betaproteobacteria bacterium]
MASDAQGAPAAAGLVAPVDAADALILFAHGARDPGWRAPVDAMAVLLARAVPEARVSVAFLEFMSPDLPQAIDAAVAAGARRVAIAPLFWAEGGHLRQEVPPMLAQAVERHPGLRLERWPVMGASPEVLAALTAVYAGRWRAG